MVYFRENIARALLDLGARENVPLAEMVSFRVGGPAAFVLKPTGEAALNRALNICRDERIPVILLGNGTNVLPPDDGFQGLILQMNGDDSTPVFEGARVAVGAGRISAAASRTERNSKRLRPVDLPADVSLQSILMFPLIMIT